MMSLALVMIAVAVLPAALAATATTAAAATTAATATCTAPLMEVNGVPDKCFWYAYHDVPMTMQFLSDLCHEGLEFFGQKGRLFRPMSKDENTRVQESVVPQMLKNDSHGYYPLDFTKYEKYNGTVWTSPNTNCVGFPADFPKNEQNKTVWGTYTCPFELMAPGMWARGEPNNSGGNEDCVHGGWDHGSDSDGPNYGLNDKACSYKYNSVICEFPSEN